jgi:hypothetical protein
LPKGAGGGTGLPAAALQVHNDFGTIGYGGPCLPPGKPHHYHITVYALGVEKLGVDQNTSPAVVGFNVHGHTLAKATLTGLYGRRDQPPKLRHSHSIKGGCLDRRRLSIRRLSRIANNAYFTVDRGAY